MIATPKSRLFAAVAQARLQKLAAATRAEEDAEIQRLRAEGHEVIVLRDVTVIIQKFNGDAQPPPSGERDP